MRQGFIHWRITIGHAGNALAITQRPVKGLAQSERYILDRMMDIDVQISLGLDIQIE